MKKLSSLRIRLVGTVFLAMLPAWALMYFTDLPWTGFLLGLAALGAAWFGGEKFILRQVRSLHSATRRLADGDFKSRTGLAGVSGEMGDLAQTFDQLAVTLQKRAEESDDAQHSLLNRALQQTVVASIGQFALISNDLDSLLTQAVMLVSQNLEVEYCSVLELPL